MVAKKAPKKKAPKKKAPKKKAAGKKRAPKKKSTQNYISRGSFSDPELKQYLNLIKKFRKNKKTKKQRKVGLTNTISFLNLLFNADKEKQKKPRRNLLVKHPFAYPSIISDHHIDDIWKATKIPAARSKVGRMNNLNNVYHTMFGYKLLKWDDPVDTTPVKSLPARPLVTPPVKQAIKSKSIRTLPIRPSVTPQSNYDYDTSDEDEADNKKKNRR